MGRIGEVAMLPDRDYEVLSVLHEPLAVPAAG
jgi:hypothetical protein